MRRDEPLQDPSLTVSDLMAHSWSVEVGQTLTCWLTVRNESSRVAPAEIQVEGLDPAWLHLPAPRVVLDGGGQATLTLTITPPRAPESRAGQQPFRVILHSPAHSGWQVVREGIVTVHPFYDFAVMELAPKEQSLSRFKQEAALQLALANRGNSDCTFLLEASETSRACTFEFILPEEGGGLTGQVALRLRSGESRTVSLRIIPLSQPILALERQIFRINVTTTMLGKQQARRTLGAQVARPPLIGPGLLALTLLALVLAATLAYLKVESWPGGQPVALAQDDLAGGREVDAEFFQELGEIAVLRPGAPESASVAAPVAVDPSTLTYEMMFQQVGAEYGLDWRLLASVAYHESRLNPRALGASQDMGLMQIIPSTWKLLAGQVGVHDPYDPYSNALVGAAFLAYLREYFSKIGYTEEKWILAGYNWGPGNVRRLIDSGGRWEDVPPRVQRYAINILQARANQSAPWWQKELKMLVGSGDPRQR